MCRIHTKMLYVLHTYVCMYRGSHTYICMWEMYVKEMYSMYVENVCGKVYVCKKELCMQKM